MQWGNVSGDDVEGSRRAAQVLLIFKTEFFLSLQFVCSARHDISLLPPPQSPLLPPVLPATEGRLMVVTTTTQLASSCSWLRDNLEE